ncbi:MAG: cytochrome c biogenesis protein CcdA [Spirochaetes bacterium]|nr:cytochrome c biogenesis protein CcdA [Spirochaetota bacterium]MBU1082057.1 cytochrome c biogenesis protein CcdA [Spirochaetota bacterium]
MIDVSIALALGAGLLSFLSPCVLPLIPGYLSFISGAGGDEIRNGSRRAGVLNRTLFFVLGFSAVFVALGLAFSGGGMLVAGRGNRLASIIGGSIIIGFGLNTIFDFLKLLNIEARARVKRRPTSAAGAFVVGMAFGAGWTPCVGPILASILFIAARSGSVAKAVLLLSAYSAGLAVPFVATGLFFERLAPLWAWFKRHGRAVRIASGSLLVAIGLSMALGRLSAVGAWAARLGIGLKAVVATRPEDARAWTVAALAALAGLVAASPLVRRKPFARPWRLAALLALGVGIAVEALGLASLAGVVAEWLLFQGA